MHTYLPLVVFLAAVCLPLFLLKRFHTAAWPLHLLAIAAGVAIGFIPGTPFLNSDAGTYLTGFSIGFFVIWGVGGLIGIGRPRGTRTA
jgi:hypothetical protein